MARKKPSMKRDSDGLTDRERAFVRERRADPEASNATCARRAGYSGDLQHLGERARVLLGIPRVAMAVHAPAPGKESKANSKQDLRRLLLAIVRSERTTAAQKIKAAHKLLATIAGGYVPVQIESRGRLTMEGIVRAMGGAPPEGS